MKTRRNVLSLPGLHSVLLYGLYIGGFCRRIFKGRLNTMNKTYLRGEMYYADLGRGIGSEQEGTPP